MPAESAALEWGPADRVMELRALVGWAHGRCGAVLCPHSPGEQVWWEENEFGLGPKEFEVLVSPRIDLCRSSLEVPDWNLLHVIVRTPFRSM